jgi:hypothetical protein
MPFPCREPPATLPRPCHSLNAGRSPTCRLRTADATSHIPCRSHAALCRGLEKSLSERHIRGMAGELHGMCELASSTAGERHGMCELAFNTAGERHGMCELAFKRTSVLLYKSCRSDVFRPKTLRLLFLSQIDWLWNKFYDNSLHFRHPWHKENLLYKTNYNSYTVKEKQTKLGVWTRVGWWYLVSGLADRSF